METLGVIGLILGGAFIIIDFIGIFRGPKIRLKYAGVFGRPSALLFYVCSFAAITWIPSTLIYRKETDPPWYIFFVIGGTVIFAGIAVLVAWWVWKKCPENLRKRLFPSMLLLGFGIATRVGFFFLFWFIKIGLMPSAETRERVARRFNEDYYREHGTSPVISNDGLTYKNHEGDPLWLPLPNEYWK